MLLKSVSDKPNFYFPRFSPSSSSVLPFVSGKYFHTTNVWIIIIRAKKANMCPPPFSVLSTTMGKRKVIRPAENQTEKLPNDWPFPRTAFGKTSAINTHTTAPVEKAKNMM